MSPEQFGQLWLINGFGMIIIGFFIKKWMNQVDSRLTNLEKRMVKMMVKMKIEDSEDDA